MPWFGLGFSIIAQIIFWAVALLALVRICRTAWCQNTPILLYAPLPVRGFARVKEWAANLIAPDPDPGAEAATHKIPYGKIILFALAVRVLMLALGYGLLMLNGQTPTLLDLLYAFRRGDSQHYLNLADIGYVWTENDRNLLLVFFPLYGWIVRVVNVVVGHTLISAYLVSFWSFAAALCYLYRLVRLDYSERVAWWTLFLISIAPHSFFFGVPMTESLFLLTTAMTLYYIRSHKWPLAGIAGAFAILTRMAGLVLVLAAAVEFLLHYRVFALLRAGKWREFFGLVAIKGLWILLMLTGGLVYLAVNWWVAGDPFQFMYYQYTHWFNQFTYFGQVIIAQFEHIRGHDRALHGTIFIPNLLAFALTIWMLWYASLRRLPLFHIVFLLSYTFLNFAVSWLLSGGRYMTAAVPLFFFLAHFTERRLLTRLLFPLVLLVGLIVMMNWYLLGRSVF